MSVVRSAAVYGNRELYSLKGGNHSSGLPKSMFNSGDHGIICTSESYSSDTYDPQVFLDSPSVEYAHTPCPDILESPAERDPFLSSLVAESCNASQLNHEQEYMCGQSPKVVDYDEEKMRLKIQELEKALLDDDDIDNHGQSMEIDSETDYALLEDSPKEASSSDSNICSISSTMEMSYAAPQTLKHLLFKCAAAIHGGDLKDASNIINELRQTVSIQGEPFERIAAYMVEALAARMATSGRGLYKALKCTMAPSSDRLSAMQVLFEVCPCFRFGFMTANGAILEACKDEKRVHIIDFDINQGSQYYTLLQTLAKIPGKRPHVRLTGVDDPESVQRQIGGLKIIGQRLKQLAEDLGLLFEFRAVASETALVSPSMLDCQLGEAVIVNFAFQLHHMPDESVSTLNLRDQLLRMVKGLKPKLVTLVEQDVNTNTSPFFTRFSDAYSYYSAVFESLEAALARDSQDRMNVEKHCLARDIINVVACEGEERIERYEVAGKWRARMSMAGFASSPISRNVSDDIRDLINQYSERYKVKEESGALHFGWEDKILIVSSAWR